MKRALLVMVVLVLWAAPALAAPSGQTLEFWGYDFYDQDHYIIQVTLLATGDHCRIYGDVTAGVSTATAQAVANRFDDVYEDVTAVYGDPPDVDGDPGIYILLTDIRDDYTHDPNAISFVRGYFDPLDETADPHSNGHEMIYLDVEQQDVTGLDARRAMAHELGRMIVWGNDPDEEAWLVEGLGYLAERINGLSHRSEIANYLAAPSVPLTGWTAARPDEGAAYLFMLYVREQFGDVAIRQIVSSTEHGLDSVAEVVGVDRGTLFRRWALANYLDRSSGVYRYGSLNIVDYDPDERTTFLRPPSTVVTWPVENEWVEVSGTLPYHGVAYYRLETEKSQYSILVQDRQTEHDYWFWLPYGAAWVRNDDVLAVNVMGSRSSLGPVVDDRFLLVVGPSREIGPVEYSFVIRGPGQVFMPVVMRDAQGG